MGIKVDPRGHVLVPRGHQNFASLHGCFSAASSHILLTLEISPAGLILEFEMSVLRIVKSTAE